MMFCPKCRSEYVEGITECAECQVPLVAELPPEDTVEYEYEHFVTLETYHARHEAELQKSVLEANGIEAVIESDDVGGVGPALAFTRGVRLLVHKDDAQKAQVIFQDLEATQEEPIAAEFPPEEETET
jgi:hypothetical protein